VARGSNNGHALVAISRNLGSSIALNMAAAINVSATAQRVAWLSATGSRGGDHQRQPPCRLYNHVSATRAAIN